MKWNGRAATSAASDGIRNAVEAGAAHLLAESQKVVPFIKGDLAASGKSGVLADGRGAVTYTDRGAVDSHERMDIPPANGKRRKYLEGPANEQRGAIAKVMQREVSRGLDR